MLAEVQEDQVKYHPDNYSKLSKRRKNLHEKAFTTNSNDPDYWKLEIGKDVKTEKGLLFRKVMYYFSSVKMWKKKKLPLVSWLVAPEHFSDHPGSPWYGALVYF